ncbi:basic proline-rich protein-like [Camarhynchus parvulus]|uniref:basic proline-rich protein-like n=1 Tax=Geospiza parvula TaxID=87175 RepID=UPI00123830A2|nr:basic proline-rich protein-like [Camarhynchus parvulus]
MPPHVRRGRWGGGAQCCPPAARPGPARPAPLPRIPPPGTAASGPPPAPPSQAAAGGTDGTGRPRSVSPAAHPLPPCRAGRGPANGGGAGANKMESARPCAPAGHPGGAAPVHRWHRSPAPVPAGGQRGGWRGSPPAPAGLGLPLPLSAAPAAGPPGAAALPRRPSATGGAAVALRGAAVQSRASLAEPRPPGAAPGARGLAVAGLRPLPDSRAPHPPSPAEAARTRPRAAPFRRDGLPPRPANGPRRAAARRYLRCGPGSPPPAATGRAPAPAPPPHRHGWAGTGRGSRGSGMWHRALLPGPRGQGSAAAPGAAAGLDAVLPGGPAPPAAAALCFAPVRTSRRAGAPAVLAPRSPPGWAPEQPLCAPRQGAPAARASLPRRHSFFPR